MPTSITLARGTFFADNSELVGPDGTTRLSPNEARLLLYLAERPGQWVDAETLQREVWGYAPRVQSRTAYVTLGRPRERIELDPRRPKHLVSARHLGYRFLPLEPSADVEAEWLLARLTALGYRVSVTRAA
jgi:DNA-binding response OmpR family regulator